jgi:hypothetical protein
MKKLVIAAAMSVAAMMSANVMACGGDGSGQHIGKVTNVNTAEHTFTIMDMESRSPMTFNASAHIMKVVQKAGGPVQVHYEEDDDGALQAVGVNI